MIAVDTVFFKLDRHLAKKTAPKCVASSSFLYPKLSVTEAQSPLAALFYEHLIRYLHDIITM
jgi:hypothetical protein